MNDTIIIDGVKYVRAEEEKPKQDPFDIKKNEKYYTIYGTGNVSFYIADSNTVDKALFEVANACKDEKIMEQRALHEILDRLLWRASVRAGELDNPWDDNHNHWEIYYNITTGNFIPDYSQYCKSHVIYFPSEESAQDAIDDIIKPFTAEHPDFVW